jgi:hypothetical protein
MRVLRLYLHQLTLTTVPESTLKGPHCATYGPVFWQYQALCSGVIRGTRGPRPMNAAGLPGCSTLKHSEDAKGLPGGK